MGKLRSLLDKQRRLLMAGSPVPALVGNRPPPGESPVDWNLLHPERVVEATAAWVAAGANLIRSNTSGAGRYALARENREDQLRKLNQTGVELARQGAGSALVVGVVNATGVLPLPYGKVAETEIAAAFREQVAVLVEAGVDAVSLENMGLLEEAQLAVKAVQEVDPGLDILVLLAFQPGSRGFQTLHGVECQWASRELGQAGVTALGGMCLPGQDLPGLLAGDLRRASKLPPVLELGKEWEEAEEEDFTRRLQDLSRPGEIILAAGGEAGPEIVARLARGLLALA
ncbi:MAG: homocysteine S-methyltransferase family protein [Planctomycetota bacterium]|nr:homocysteine S-methyltransferase family protein [Planctomycetota bacterium]